MLALGWALGSTGACFDAPMPAVQFSCDPDEAPACPTGYTCEADGCCHRDGSNVDEHRGQCQLGGAISGSGTGPTPTTEGSTGESTSEATGESTSDSTGGTTSGSTTDSGSSSDGGSSSDSTSTG
ncbi:hypothetical protein [Paraliomyxa miuraensis]|uniref:hypothetical protein n=1 Tax=Paraliomyxa miuraensis TaxID=376150 RepID=UPI0022535377|nr:hypothetical protein [Paraliomyxa miuraensis]MCX4242843.1 hypothetical protein [Paraliomyxa miuraensis]